MVAEPIVRHPGLDGYCARSRCTRRSIEMLTIGDMIQAEACDLHGDFIASHFIDAGFDVIRLPIEVGGSDHAE